MKAILLAAGFGTRLRPITDSVPKCLVPVKGKPLLQIWLERLNVAGIDEYLVNTHYLHEQVNDFIRSSGYQDKIDIAYEPVLLGTAGTLLANLDFFEGKDGMLIHADNYCLADFPAFIKAHQQRPAHCVMTMMVFRTDNPSSCGIVELDEQQVVKDFHEKVASPPGNLANGAVYILSAELLSRLGKDLSHVQDFSTEVLHRFIGSIYTYETAETFLDIGTPETYRMANSY
jgi:mannose-1-phosphate guanylyltransferase